jgi:hypothetical protein
MKVKHFVGGETGRLPLAIEWKLEFSKAMNGPVLKARNVGDDRWQDVLAIDEDGLLDATFSPEIRGLVTNSEGYIAAVPMYEESCE